MKHLVKNEKKRFDNINNWLTPWNTDLDEKLNEAFNTALIETTITSIKDESTFYIVEKYNKKK